MPDFNNRANGQEIMDNLHVSGVDLHRALRELESINYLLGGNYVTLNGLTQLLDKKQTTEDIHVADVGCGSGDMLKLMRKLLERRKISAMLTGIDANPNVITYAAAHTPAVCRIQYEVLDIFSDEFKKRRFDVVTGTLFFHHFTSQQLVAFFNTLKDQVSTGLIINDIHRHWFAYYAIKWLTKIFSRSPMVRHDGPLSVLRAFNRNDIVEILERAGIRNYRIKWCWAFRWQVIVRF
jgi:2-polyprenyl-3-methyl-5-hydroxy-6-metoxy-1,4-benzoquinol methylase